MFRELSVATNKNVKGNFEMQQISINELKPHPRNSEFFDDITGEKWDELLSSVNKRIKDGKRGNIEPIIITQDKTIVSGHQRVRAFKELKIPTIESEIRIYNTDDEVLLDLLESNVRRRGEVGGSAKKVGKRIKELERLYGIYHGNNQHGGHENNSHPIKTQKQLADDLGMDVRTLQNYKLLADMIPELEELMETGIVSKTTVLAVMKELSKDEQEELISSLDTTKKITKKEVEKYIAENKNSKKQIDSSDKQKLVSEVNRLKKETESLKSRNEDLKRANELSDDLIAKYKEEAEEYMHVKSQITKMGLDKNVEYNLYGAASEVVKLHEELQEILLNKLSPVKYQPFMFSLKENTIIRKNFLNTLEMVYEWYREMMEFIGEDIKNNTKDEIIDMEELNEFLG